MRVEFLGAVCVVPSRSAGVRWIVGMLSHAQRGVSCFGVLVRRLQWKSRATVRNGFALKGESPNLCMKQKEASEKQASTRAAALISRRWCEENDGKRGHFGAGGGEGTQPGMWLLSACLRTCT